MKSLEVKSDGICDYAKSLEVESDDALYERYLIKSIENLL